MIYPANEENIVKAATAIKEGEVVAFPTETVYGLGANALDASAVVKIFEIKQRPFFDPLIVHVCSREMVEEIADAIPLMARKCMDAFWPGPLTIVLPKKKCVPDIVTAGLPTVAVRMPIHEVAQKLIRCAGVPIAAPSANPFGYLSPTEACHVQKQLGSKVNIILDGGRCTVGVESTIVKVEDDSLAILRFGGIPVEDIERVVGKVVYPSVKTIEVPGQLPYHYAPSTRVVIVDEVSQIPDNRNCGALLFKKHGVTYQYTVALYLSEDGDLRQAAMNLFSCLHDLDAMHLDIIYVEKVPEIGLGKAIMERLKKAQARHSVL